MLCDELWMMCVRAHQHDLRREVVRQVLQQRARASMPQRHGPWWQALGHILSGYWIKLRLLWRPRRRRLTDEPAVLWEHAHDLAVATVRIVRAPRHRASE
jgi:hypothetical protein